MAKVLIIPDIHLKPWILRRVDEILEKEAYDRIAFLGDVVDDWNQENNQALYDETFDKMIELIAKYKNLTPLFCYGNHELSYVWEKNETGYSPMAKKNVLLGLERLSKILPNGNIGFVHLIDNIIISHAGIDAWFIEENIPNFDGDMNELVKQINNMGVDELWRDISPIWSRFQNGFGRPYITDYLQVVGHTPIKYAYAENGILSLDTFSTYRDGTPIGEQRFVWVDSITKEWHYVN